MVNTPRGCAGDTSALDGAVFARSAHRSGREQASSTQRDLREGRDGAVVGGDAGSRGGEVESRVAARGDEYN
jgi:hypothetical protein